MSTAANPSDLGSLTMAAQQSEPLAPRQVSSHLKLLKQQEQITAIMANQTAQVLASQTAATGRA